MSRFFLILLLLHSFAAFAQDERYIRQMFEGDLPDFYKDFLEKPQSQFNISGPHHQIDLNQDGLEEIIIIQKRDGVDWIEIRSLSHVTLFESKIFSPAADSVIYKLKLVTISKNVKALILFLDEGSTVGKRFESTGRIYVLSFENNDLKKISLNQGPHFFIEREAFRDTYFRRNYVVNVIDFDSDGVKEISVQFNHIQRVLRYSGNGKWVRF